MRFLVMLLTVLALSVCGCTRQASNPDEAAAIALVQKLGGKIETDEQTLDHPVTKVYLHATPVTNADLAVVARLPRLRNLFLGKTTIGDDGLQHLAQARQLQTLALNGTAVSDEGLHALTGLTQLKTLNLQETKVTAAGVNQLKAKLPGLNIAR